MTKQRRHLILTSAPTVIPIADKGKTRAVAIRVSKGAAQAVLDTNTSVHNRVWDLCDRALTMKGCVLDVTMLVAFSFSKDHGNEQQWIGRSSGVNLDRTGLISLRRALMHALAKSPKLRAQTRRSMETAVEQLASILELDAVTQLGDIGSVEE